MFALLSWVCVSVFLIFLWESRWAVRLLVWVESVIWRFPCSSSSLSPRLAKHYCISIEWQVGMDLFKVTVTLSTIVRVQHCGACVCGCECAYTPLHSVRCRSTAEWLRSGRLGPSMSGLVPALSFPTHLVFLLPCPPSLVVSSAFFLPPALYEDSVAPLAELWAAFTSVRE